MGCTPSIHVSQTGGMVFCKDSPTEDSNSPINPMSVATTATTQGGGGFGGGGFGGGGVSHMTTKGKLTTKAKLTSIGPSGLRMPGQASMRPENQFLQGVSITDEFLQRVSITEAETQTSRDMVVKIKGGTKPIHLGPMQLQQQHMSVLLLFAKEDAQSDGFWWAADKGGYVCSMSRTAEDALDAYLDRHHQLIIVDARTTKHFDAETLCRSIRKSNENTVIVAVTKRLTVDKEEPSIIPLLSAGFNRRFIENASISVCLNELLALEHGDVRAAVKLTAANSWLRALELSADAVQVTDAQTHRTQYVNPAYERLFGYTCDELQGQDSWSVPLPADKFKKDTILARLRKGESWEGIYSSMRKSGETVSHHCRISPVNNSPTAGKVQHFVCIKNPLPDTSQSLEKYSELAQLTNGGMHMYPSGRRRESMARIQSMTIEAPITKVINIINVAKAESPLSVVAALDKVLEILQSSELYSPYFSVHKDDQMTNDLVGGLMATSREHSLDIQSTRSASQSMKRRLSGQEVDVRGVLKTPVTAPPNPSATSLILSNVPQDVQDVLAKEDTWDFNILDLERITNKQALVYLGLKTFQRFGVMDYLRCSEETMCAWLQLIEANYHTSNTYHNSTHAADVMQASAYFLGRDRIKSIMEPEDEVVSLLSATVHDLNHPGKTNSFLVNAGSDLALLYNDIAVLESHHAAMAFQLTWKSDQSNIFKNLERDEYKVLRQQIIDMVLATEMTRHFEHLSKFVSSANAISKDDVRNMSGTSSPADSVSTMGSQRLSSVELRMLVKRMLIKCADVSNPLRPLPLCKEWAFRISEEYFAQTDEEKKRRLPVVMPVFDRKTCNVPKSQTSFIDFFIKDMFDAWDTFCNISGAIKHLDINYMYWEAQVPRAEHELQERQRDEDEEVSVVSS